MVVDFFIAMTLGPQPYYWPTDASYGSSPPIATRSGWMALALLPFVLWVLDSEHTSRLLTFFQGTEHES